VREQFNDIPDADIGSDVVARGTIGCFWISIEFEGKELQLDVQEARNLVKWLLAAIPTKDGC
jgi:hypothetical protein